MTAIAWPHNSNKAMRNILFFLFFVSSFSVVAQEVMPEVTRIVPPDAEVSGLGTYGQYNKNLSTGQIDISTSIHELQGISLKYALGLSYNHSGIRVEDRSTSVGLNWNFQGIGVITKTVVGSPDEEPTYGYNSAYVYSSQFNTALYTPTDLSTDKVVRAALGAFDMEPDIFSFSFNGRNGKFYYNPSNGQYYCIPFAKLSITRIGSGEAAAFQVVDEKGYRYLFDQTTVTNYDFGTSPFEQDKSMTYTSQWYLSGIYAPDGNLEFSFEYQQDKLVNEQLSSSQSISYLYSGSGPCEPGTYNPIMPVTGGSSSYGSVNRRGLLLNKIISPLESAQIYYKDDRTDGSMRLDSITFFKNNVRNTNWKFFQSSYSGANKLRLDSLTKYAVSEGRVSSYNFEYNSTSIPSRTSKSQDHWGYYNGAANSSLIPKIWHGAQYLGDADRSSNLTNASAGILTKIKFPTGGTSEFLYELNDYGSLGTPGNLVDEPITTYTSKSLNRRFATQGSGTSTLSFTIDKTEVISFTSYRDNCNNKTTTCSLDPVTTSISLSGNGSTWSLNGASKQTTTNVISLLAGTYTVSITTSDYQDYGQVSFQAPSTTGYNKKVSAGGLRIKKIINYDPVSNQSDIRRFEYLTKNDLQRSAGTILSLPNYIYTNQTGRSCGSSLPSCDAWRITKIITSHSNNELYFSEGAPVAYTRVVEFIGENGEGGKIEHIFSYASDQGVRGFPFPAPSSRSWQRGLPLQTNFLTFAGDTVSKEINEYYFEPTRNFNKITGYKTGFFKYCPYSAASTQINIEPTDYTSQWFYLRTNRKISYFSGQAPIEERTDYFYDNENHARLTKIKKTLAGGNVNNVYYKYAGDYNLAAGSTDPATSALFKMQANNMVDYIVEQTETFHNGTQEVIRGSLYNTYKEFSTAKIYNWQQYKYESFAPEIYSSLTGVIGNTVTFNAKFSKQVEILSYSQRGLIKESQDKGGIKRTYQYHSNGILPLAFASNAAANQIYYNGFEDEAGSNISSLAKFGNKSYNGIYSISGNSLVAGNYIKYWWENIGGLWVYNTQKFTHDGLTAINTGSGQIIDNLTIFPENAEIESYDYDLSKGLIGKVDSTGNGIQISYDSLLRLKYIKDQTGNIVKSYDYHYKP